MGCWSASSTGRAFSTAAAFQESNARLLKQHSQDASNGSAHNRHHDSSNGVAPHDPSTADADGMHVQRMLFENIKEPGDKQAAKDEATPSDPVADQPTTTTTTSSSSAATVVQDELHKLDLRVGRIVTAQKHPDADALCVEQVDLGDEAESGQDGRVIVSGLLPYMTVEELQGRMVIVVKNMKPTKLRGIRSYGMLLCAESNGKVEPLHPPAESGPGERVFAHIYDQGQPDLVLNPKKKVWDRVAQHLTVDGEGVAKYRDEPLRTQHGLIRTHTVMSGIVR